jgi:dTDP-glucose 4,6-dehydratase
MHEDHCHWWSGFHRDTLVRHLVAHTDHQVLVVDKLTYAGNLASLASVQDHPRYHFNLPDICDHSAIADVFSSLTPTRSCIWRRKVMSIDRSIDGPADFINTNVIGSYVLLEAALAHWRKLGSRAQNFRFLHVSTDEVYGALKEEGCFTEETRYDPRSPYSASKAASDHLVRACASHRDLINFVPDRPGHDFPTRSILPSSTQSLAGRRSTALRPASTRP